LNLRRRDEVSLGGITICYGPVRTCTRKYYHHQRPTS
jgi:hypothetical protein